MYVEIILRRSPGKYTKYASESIRRRNAANRKYAVNQQPGPIVACVMRSRHAVLGREERHGVQRGHGEFLQQAASGAGPHQASAGACMIGYNNVMGARQCHYACSCFYGK